MTQQDEPVFVYATFPDLETAEKIAGELVEARLAACANLLPGMVSVYRWQGKIERGGEVAAIFKTRSGKAEALMEVGADRHPYDTPAFVRIDLTGGVPDFIAWIMQETAD